MTVLQHRNDDKNNINSQYDPKHDEKNRFDNKSKGNSIKHFTEFHRTVIIIQEPKLSKPRLPILSIIGSLTGIFNVHNNRAAKLLESKLLA